MFEQACPQCKRPSIEAAHRLVRDSCGHQKCRVCLLQDEEQCKQCQTDGADQQQQPPSVIKLPHQQSPPQLSENNHTGVITCNGTAKKPEVRNGNDGKDEIEVPENRPPKTPKRKPQQQISSSCPSHITVTNDPIKYKCNVCNREFNTKNNIKYHIYCTGKTKPFQCPLCSKDFVTKSQLDLHMLKHSGTKPFVCGVCDKSFSEKCKLTRHSALHNPSKSYMCSECGKTFRSKDSLRIHGLIHRGEKPYTCQVCGLGFNSSSNLRKHYTSHSKEKVHMCDQCGKRFKSRKALMVHRKSHLRIRPFECATCGRTFVNNKDLQRHNLIHLETRAFNCSICMTSFRRKDNLYRHAKNTHPGKKAEAIATTTMRPVTKQQQHRHHQQQSSAMATIPPKPVIDNPNAINVITASPACKINNNRASAESGAVSGRISDGRGGGTVINGPLKLAFKTNAFKSSYNIRRDCDFDLLPGVSKCYDMAESVNICQKILSPHSPPTARSIIKKMEPPPTSTEICQKILSPYPTRPVHYETSFEHKKHAIIKNIKFKLPANYTNLNKANDTLKDVFPLTPVANVGLNLEKSLTNSSTYADLKTVQNVATSVIVNSPSSSSSSMHWRRRTSQNLNSKTLEN